MEVPVVAATSGVKDYFNQDWTTPFAHVDCKGKSLEPGDPVFPVTNEDMHKAVYAELRGAPVCGNTYVGVSGLQNLALFACRPEEVDHLVIIDPSRFQQRYWELIKEAILCSETGPDAQSVLYELAKDMELFHRASIEPELVQYLQTTDSVFYNEAAWQKIKRCVDKGNLHILSVNLGNDEKVGNFRATLAVKGFCIDTLYLSNINEEFWLGPERTLHAVRLLTGGADTNLLLCAGNENCPCCQTLPLTLQCGREFESPKEIEDDDCRAAFPMRVVNLFDKMRLHLIQSLFCLEMDNYFEVLCCYEDDFDDLRDSDEWQGFWPQKAIEYHRMTRRILFRLESQPLKIDMLQHSFAQLFPKRYSRYQANPTRWPFVVESVNNIFMEMKETFLFSYFATRRGLEMVCFDFSVFQLPSKVEIERPLGRPGYDRKETDNNNVFLWLVSLMANCIRHKLIR